MRSQTVSTMHPAQSLLAQ